MVKNKAVPVGVKVISVLLIIIPFILLIFVIGGFSNSENMGAAPIILGLFLLTLIVTLPLALSLWKSNNFARILTIVLSFVVSACLIFLLIYFMILYSSYTSLNIIPYFYMTITVIMLFTIGLYLLFSKKVKEAFN